jgi:hypothetical protein
MDESIQQVIGKSETGTQVNHSLLYLAWLRLLVHFLPGWDTDVYYIESLASDSNFQMSTKNPINLY